MALTLEVGTAYDYPTIEDAAAALGLTLTSGRDWSSLDGAIPGMVVDQKMIGTPTTPGVYTVTAREVSIYGDYYTKTADVTVNGPEPEPEPAGSTLVPDVLEFLGLPDNPDMRKLATQHVRIVTTFVRNYTRGNGFDAEGVPNADLHDVIITATARYLPNPQQATRQSLGNQSIGYATIEGFTLTEKAVLNRYRKMTSRGNIVTTTSTGTGGTTTYATVDYVDSKVAGIPTTDLDGYATTAYVDDVARSLTVDLNPYATRSYVDVAIDGIPDVDLTDYVTNGELSAALEALPEPETVDLAPYALKTEIPAAPDLTPYATTSYVDQRDALSIPRQTGSTTRTLKNGWQGEARLQRTGNLVILTLSNLSQSDGTKDGAFLDPPAGYGLPNVAYARPGMVVSVGGDARLASGTKERGVYLASYQAGTSYHGTLIWVTADAWPVS